MADVHAVPPNAATLQTPAGSGTPADQAGPAVPTAPTAPAAPVALAAPAGSAGPAGQIYPEAIGGPAGPDSSPPPSGTLPSLSVQILPSPQPSASIISQSVQLAASLQPAGSSLTVQVMETPDLPLQGLPHPGVPLPPAPGQEDFDLIHVEDTDVIPSPQAENFNYDLDPYMISEDELLPPSP